MRYYRTMQGHWGFGVTRSPGGWTIQLGRHVFTTDPDGLIVQHDAG